MSRLESAIRRLEAQRRCLDRAAAMIGDLPGPVVELGLGNGRTFDHLRERLPERAIFVLERDPRPHPDCWPSADRLIEGDFADSLERARSRLPAPAALAHADIGAGDPRIDAAVASLLAERLPALMRPGGIVLCDQPLASTALAPLSLPEGVAPGRYHFYRRLDRPDAAPTEEERRAKEEAE